MEEKWRKISKVINEVQSDFINNQYKTMLSALMDYQDYFKESEIEKNTLTALVAVLTSIYSQSLISVNVLKRLEQEGLISVRE